MVLAKTDFSDLIRQFKFRELFNEMGWDNDHTSQTIVVEDKTYQLNSVAAKNGFKVLVCTSCGKEIPDKSTRRKIQRNVARLFFEHLIIYQNENRSKQLWQTAIRLPNKPVKIHEVEWNDSQDPEILYQRASGLFFTFEEEGVITIVDVLKRVQENFNTNSEKVTKKFYERFKKEHDAFYSFIVGIENETDQKWYASLMLNRLMFIYFIQKKGFLDNNKNYLKDKLQQVKESHGTDKFYKSFYKIFLCRLFHEGLGKPHETDKELIKLIGKIPYLNGGLFDIHELEKDNDDLDVNDEAFERLFEFFDEYNWHLDDRITASGKDINPDVLGYIFEKYINDRAQMGAYYTKEDITEYISKNCIIPFLFDRTKEKCANAFLPGSSLWEMLKQDPDRYIYDAVKHGADFNKGLKDGLPDDVIEGIDAPDDALVEKRKCWNRTAPSEVALPTEIYREVIERRKRYFDIRQKIENGKVHEINDFITYNLNIRQFAQDAVENYEGSDFIQSFFEAIAGRKYDEKKSGIEPTLGITILDPTCGSGAFLFAALNILEPLYEGCIKRMYEFVEDDDNQGSKHFRQFRIVLNEIKEHPSEAYYIVKSIILNNLYGVDIMKEAVETAKLRLFLKLVSEVDDVNLIEPLPDIDFNIKQGNSLVGFANWQELLDITQGAYKGTLLKIEDSLDKCKLAYTVFKSACLVNNFSTKETKKALQTELKKVNSQLNIFLAKLYRVNPESDNEFHKWIESHQPFHWFAEFYEIIHDNGGFNVIIGNPPYIEIKDVKSYKINNYKTIRCGNLYAICYERALHLCKDISLVGFIIPVASVCTDGYRELQKLWIENGSIFISCYNDRPGKLFEGLEHIRLSIVLFKKLKKENKIFATQYYKWNTIARENLFSNLFYKSVTHLKDNTLIPKVNSSLGISILLKVQNNRKRAAKFTIKSSNHKVLFTRKLSGFVQILNFVPKILDQNGYLRNPSELKELNFETDEKCKTFLSVYNSSLFYWYLTLWSDCRNLNQRELLNFNFDFSSAKTIIIRQLRDVSTELMQDLEFNSIMQSINFKKIGKLEIQCIFPKLSKVLIDKIDTVLAKHYDFTAEELDFIINYDIKYRMGSELGNGVDDE